MTDLLTKKIEAKIKQYGSLRKAAMALQVDHSYLWKLQHGEKNNPSDKLLRQLGLIRTVSYITR